MPASHQGRLGGREVARVCAGAGVKPEQHGQKARDVRGCAPVDEVNIRRDQRCAAQDSGEAADHDELDLGAE